MTERLLADRIRSGEKLLGGLLRLPNPYLTELCGLHGLDYVAFDCEHGPSDVAVLHEHVLVAQAHGLETLVRLPQHDSDTLLRALDAGASGIIAPRVATAGQAADLVDVASYPPRGRRGFATYTPAGRYGLTPAGEHLADATNRLVLLVMIEDAAGVHNAGSIAAVPGITGTLVGPADLAVSMGIPGEVGHDSIRAALREVHDATTSASGAVMVIVGTADAARAAFAGGAQMVLYNVAMALNDAFWALSSARPGKAGASDGARP